MNKVKNIVYIFLLVLLSSGLVLDMIPGLQAWGRWVSSPLSLLSGLAFALIFGPAFPEFNKKMSKKLLQYSVIGLGFGMNVNEALKSGSEGMLFTIFSVFGTLLAGYILGRKLLKVDKQTSYLISSGTAICGGSAIAAVGPVIKARAESMSVALGVVFILNAVGLIVFPLIGDVLGMGMKDFGMWAAIAIHDTSSVVGAGAAYDALHPELVASQGVSALEVATTVKLTRALWIVVLAVISPFFFKAELSGKGGRQPVWKAVPTFILWFIAAILLNTYVLSNTSLMGGFAPQAAALSKTISAIAKQAITLSLFFIGASLTRQTLKAVGLKPLVQGVLLWITISLVSLGYILLF